MRTSPSGPKVPNEYLRHSFPLATALAGKTVAPLWSSPGISPIDQSTPAITAAFFAIPPGNLGTMTIAAVGESNSGSPIKLKWILDSEGGAIETPPPVTVIDPSTNSVLRLDFSDVVIPDRGGLGAGIYPILILPPDLVISTLYVIITTEIFWK